MELKIKALSPKLGKEIEYLSYATAGSAGMAGGQALDMAGEGRALGREELEDLKPDCLILDLASKPGGVDLGAAGELGLTVIWALSLPGKVAPVTAGATIKDTIYNMLREIGM